MLCAEIHHRLDPITLDDSSHICVPATNQARQKHSKFVLIQQRITHRFNSRLILIAVVECWAIIIMSG
jgi:hypothetical protein